MTTAEQHFSTEAVGSPSADGRFVVVESVHPVELVPGLEFRPVLGEHTMVNFVHFAPRTEAPRHVHEEEQIVIVLEGELDFELDGEVRTIRPGDVVVIPPWVPHGARTQDESCLEVDVFNPPRRTLLEHASAERERARPATAAEGDAGLADGSDGAGG
jgi:quercetin dioxygenase-like cupin family protein